MSGTSGKDVSGTKSGTARSDKRKVLLVNDDESMRQVLARLLAEEDFLVLTATNGDEALQLANRKQFDLVLLDLKSPLEGEWENLGHLAAANPLLPVVLITDRHSEYFHALASGVGALVEKPLNFVKLFDTIHRLLEEPAEERRARFLGRPAAFHYIPSPDGYGPGKLEDDLKISDTNDVLVWLRTIDKYRKAQAQLSCAPATGEPTALPAITNTTPNNQRKEQHDHKPN